MEFAGHEDVHVKFRRMRVNPTLALQAITSSRDSGGKTPGNEVHPAYGLGAAKSL